MQTASGWAMRLRRQSSIAVNDMPKDFRDREDAGMQLAGLIARADHDCVVAIGVGGQAVAQVVARELQLPLVAIGDAHGRVLVVDDAVEGGGTAHAAAEDLERLGHTLRTLAVPLCPRESEYLLRQDYRDIVAVVRPMMRRAAAWHYDSLD